MMLQHILVPLDGTPQAAVALPLARTLAGIGHGQLTLLSVGPDGGARRDRAADAARRQTLEDIARELSQAELQATASVRYGEVASEIVDEVRASQCELVVMATHGRAGLDRVLHGTVAGEVLRASPVPVVLLRPGGRRVAHLDTLLVPIDETPGGALALGAATQLARASGARIVLVEAIPPVPTWLSMADAGAAVIAPDPAWDEAALAGARAFVDELAARLGSSGLRAEGVARAGNVPRTILAVGDEVEADLIVMSTHALDGPARALLGSVADAVVRAAQQPVLLLRRDPPVR